MQDKNQTQIDKDNNSKFEIVEIMEEIKKHSKMFNSTNYKEMKSG